jgi:integrase
MRQTTSTKPYYRQAKGTWYAWVNGSQVSLKVKGKGSRKEAQEALGRLIYSPPPPPAAPTAANRVTVAQLVTAYLDDARVRMPERLPSIKPALALLDPFRECSAMSLKPYEVERLVTPLAISNSSKWTYLSWMVACFRRCIRMGLIDRNPLEGLQKPKNESRGSKVVLTDDEFGRLCDNAKPKLRLFLRGLWLTGVRPGELARLRAQDVNWEAGVAVLTEHKTAHKTGKPRLIVLSPDALALLRSLTPRGDGLLLTNQRGNPWRKETLYDAIKKARTKANLPHAICYGMRHSYATRALASGVPDALVSALLGHQGTAMLHRHYSHLTSRMDVLKEAARKVR